MDCEKYENILLDELYDELDEVTSAAAKRHVSGCARCAALSSGLRATKRVAVLPLVSPPADLEDRILAAAREAQKVVPMRRRLSNIVSLAGTWAMRPQTAMAALFLLMIGSSALLLKGKVAKPPSSTMIVSEQGEPVESEPTAMAAAPEAPAGKGAGASGQAAAAAAPQASSAPGDAVDNLMARSPRPKMDVGRLRDPSEESDTRASGGGGGGSLAHQSLGGFARSQPAVPASPALKTAQAPPAPRAAAAPALADEPANAHGAPSKDDGAQAVQKALGPGSDFDRAMNAYNSGDYATAIQLWDAGARNGDLNSALWQARAVRESSGCGAAAPKLDRVAQQGGASAVAYDSMFDAARCYRALGQLDAARARLNQLLLVPSYIHRAQGELNAMGPKTNAKVRAQQQQPAPSQSQSPLQASPPPASTNGL